MPKVPSEFEIQRAVCIQLDGQKNDDGTWKVLPLLRPDVVYWHTPNGEQRDGFTGKRLKEMGVKAGIHDLLFFHQARLFGLELKAPDKKPSSAQLAMHARLLAAGMAASAIRDSLQGALDQLRIWKLLA